MKVIAQTNKKYTSFTALFTVEAATEKNKAVLMTIGFRDSYQFLNMSLNNFVRNFDLDSQMVRTQRIFLTQ